VAPDNSLILVRLPFPFHHRNTAPSYLILARPLGPRRGRRHRHPCRSAPAVGHS
jgi:hypothetical protein